MPEELKIPQNKADLLAQIDREYADFTALLLARPEAQRAEVWDDGRSFKDLTAHVADWESYALARLNNHASETQTPPRIVNDSDLDVVNAQIQAKYADISWEDAWSMLETAHANMRAHLAQMPDADLFDAERSPYIVGEADTNVLELIIYNTSFHYREHADEIRATT